MHLSYSHSINHNDASLALWALCTLGRTGDVAKYIMVLSDGESRTKESITTAMKDISAARIKTFVVAVGASAQQEESRYEIYFLH